MKMFEEVIADTYKEDRDALVSLCCIIIRTAATTRLEAIIVYNIMEAKTEAQKKEAKSDILKEERRYSSRFRFRKEDNVQPGILKKRLEVFK